MFVAALFLMTKEQKQPKHSQLMDGQSVVYSHNGILFNHKKRSTEMCYNTDEPYRHQAKLKKSLAKGHILYKSIYINTHNRQIHKNQKADQWLLGTRE